MKIHQCHNCKHELGAELIPCPNCESGMKEVFQFFEINKGSTKEEAHRTEHDSKPYFYQTLWCFLVSARLHYRELLEQAEENVRKSIFKRQYNRVHYLLDGMENHIPLKPLSKKAFLDLRGAFVSYMNDPTVTEQEKMGVDLCLMALDSYYEYKNDWNKVQSKEDSE